VLLVHLRSAVNAQLQNVRNLSEGSKDSWRAGSFALGGSRDEGREVGDRGS
jgi:hypothetical protein